jgi:hypothetical protein
MRVAVIDYNGAQLLLRTPAAEKKQTNEKTIIINK